jgi:hypothetical protein
LKPITGAGEKMNVNLSMQSVKGDFLAEKTREG